MSVKVFGSTAVAMALGLTVLASPAAAADPEFSANVGVVTDYVFRGFSQTDENPAVQGGVDMTVGNFYAGVWGSTIDFGDDSPAEVDIYGGYRTEALGFAWDFGVVGYLYPSAEADNYDFVEFKVGASRAFGDVTLGGAVFYSPQFFGIDEEAYYYELNGAVPIADKWTVSAAIGRQTLDVSDDYATWNVGVVYAFDDNISFDVRYHDTDTSDIALAEGRLVGGLKFAF